MSKETPEQAVARIAAKRSMQKPKAKPADRGKAMQKAPAKRTKRTRQRARKVTIADRKALFVAELARRGIVTDAAIAAGVGRTAVYEWYQDDAAFAAAWDDAKEQACDCMEAEAFRRAVDGCVKPVFQGGRHVGDIREYSDTLLVAMLKANRPAKYRERYEVTGKDGGPIQHEDVTDAPLQDLVAEATALCERAAAAGGSERGDRPAAD